MRTGICTPIFRPSTGIEVMLATTQTAERLRWLSAFTTDRVLVDAAERGKDNRHIYVALASVARLAWANGVDSPGRERDGGAPVKRARTGPAVATIDALSQGRLVAGVGIDWTRFEFESLGEGDGPPSDSTARS